MPDLGEGVSTNEPDTPETPCADESSHVWKEVDSGADVDSHISNLDASSKQLEGKPSKAGLKRGYDFEKKAVEDNRNKMPIEKCSKQYKCEICQKNQEVDIAGTDRIAEAKSRNENGVKKKSAQSKRLKSIQAQHFDAGKKPLAKIDGSLDDVEKSREIYERRGFDVEIVC